MRKLLFYAVNNITFIVHIIVAITTTTKTIPTKPITSEF